MPLDLETVRRVAYLARLQISPDEAERIRIQLEKILEHVERLRALDVEGLEPLVHAADLANAPREDRPAPSLPAEAALANAPERAGAYFVVPRILEQP